MSAFITEQSYARGHLCTVVGSGDIQSQVSQLARMVNAPEDSQLEQVLEKVKQGALSELSEQDLQSFTYVLLPQIISNEPDVAAINSLAEAIANSTAGASRYTCLAAILNSLPLEKTKPELPLSILKHMLDIAISREELHVLSPFLDQIQSHLASWNVQGEALEQAIFDVVQAQIQTGKRAEAHSLLTSFLSSSDLNTPTTPKLAKEVALLSLSLNQFYAFYTVANLPCIKLVKDSEPDLWAILAPFLPNQDAKIDDLVKLVQSSSSSSSTSAISKYGFDANILLTKARCISLADLASKNVGSDIGYSDVKTALALDNDDEETIEGWVIEAVRSKLIMARIHQLSKTIHILRASPRAFTNEEWTVLEQRLQSWRSTLDVMLETVNKATAQQPQSKSNNNNNNNNKDKENNNEKTQNANSAHAASSEDKKVYVRPDDDVEDSGVVTETAASS